MSLRASRKAPPLWILLDILMLWVLALIAMPVAQPGVTYKFLGLPADSVLFEVDLPFHPDQRRWRHFDFRTVSWVESGDTTPHGRENFLCEACATFLPPERRDVSKGLLVGISTEMRSRVQEQFFNACRTGSCALIINIHEDGGISVEKQGHD